MEVTEAKAEEVMATEEKAVETDTIMAKVGNILEMLISIQINLMILMIQTIIKEKVWRRVKKILSLTI